MHFDEQLGDVAARVVDHLALLDRLAAIELVALQKRGARGVDLDFERNAELVAVVQHVGVDGGQARGAGVEVEAFVKGAGLLRAVGEVDARAAADGPVAAADAIAGFEHGAGVAELGHLVGGDQAGDASAEDDDAGAVAGDAADGLRFGGSDGQQAEGLHHGEGGAVAAHLPYTEEKLTPGKCHTKSFVGREP